MSQRHKRKANKSTNIGDLPTDMIHKILEHMPIQHAARTSILSKHWRQMWITLPHLVFDRKFFHHVSIDDDDDDDDDDNNGDGDSDSDNEDEDDDDNGGGDDDDRGGIYAASVINKIVMQHSGPILGLHIIMPYDSILKYSDLDQCIIFVSKLSIQKLTLDLVKGRYELPYGIMTCSSLTHLKLSMCGFKMSDICIKFPNLVCLELKDAYVHGGSALVLPLLQTFRSNYCYDVGFVRMESPKLENLSIHLRGSCVSFIRLNLNQIYKSIKHLCLNWISLVALAELCQEPERLVQQLKLQSLMIRDSGKISVKHLSCVLCLLFISPNLYELEINAPLEVDESDTMELVSSLSNAEIKLNGALGTIRTVRLREFKGSRSEMCCIKFLLAHSPKLERMIVRSMNSTPTERIDHLTELTSFPRVSPKAVIKYYCLSG